MAYVHLDVLVGNFLDLDIVSNLTSINFKLLSKLHDLPLALKQNIA